MWIRLDMFLFFNVLVYKDVTTYIQNGHYKVSRGNKWTHGDSWRNNERHLCNNN